MSATQMTGEEMAESLTGFDELAITKHFGKEDFSELPGSMGARALVFVALRRDGRSDKDAYDEVMAMTLKACGDYFAESEPEVMEDEPTSESGKDDESGD